MQLFTGLKIGYVLFGDFGPPLPTLRICPRMPGWLIGITEIVGVEFSTKSIPTVEKLISSVRSGIVNITGILG